MARGRLAGARRPSLKEAEIAKGEWIAPELGALYTGLLKNHLYPTFSEVSLSDIDEASVRRWRKARLEAGPKAKRPFGPVTVAKAYRLLHAIFETTAEEDRLIPRNPCHIKGAGQEASDEREIVPLATVFKLAEAVPIRYRALILLATFADMRFGELAGLRRENIDLEACEIRITQALINPGKGGLYFDTPKSQEQGPRVGGLAGSAPPRPAPHRGHPGGGDWRDPQGTHGPARTLQPACCADLPARHPRPRPAHRHRASATSSVTRGTRRVSRRKSDRSAGSTAHEQNGHATGT
jgi:integrase